MFGDMTLPKRAHSQLLPVPGLAPGELEFRPTAFCHCRATLILLLMFKRTQAPRGLLLLALHTGVFCLCYWMAFQLRFDFLLPAGMRSLLWGTLAWVLAIKLAAFIGFRGLHGWWSYVTFADLVSVLRSCTLATVAIAGVDYFLFDGWQIPRAVLFLDWGSSVLAIGGMRSAWRLGREHVWAAFKGNDCLPVLVIGAARGGETLSRQIHNHPDLPYRIVGFLDEDQSLHGSRLGGIPFLGGPEDAIRMSTRYRVGEILVITNSISVQCLRELIEQCRQSQICLKMIPAIDQLLDTSFHLKLRDVEIADLLRRDPIHLDSKAIAEMLGGRRVMVTGAGGSIGSEICRLIARHQPESLILVERAENSLFEIEQELGRTSSDLVCHPCLADICDRDRLAAVFEHRRPQIVFHAAAHKHVPLMELNPGEAIKNNVFGTQNVADLADRFGIERFVMISTDKAVNPTSIMGISKELAERYVLALAERSAFKYVVVRFGNVLGSAGSVIPIFREQIRQGGPLTVTHPEMRRFFMTIPEASQLVLQAAVLGQGGEVFVLDMGEPIKIVDLAHDLIRLSGLSPDDIQLTVVGTRPGEKLHEELLLEEEQTLSTPHPKLRIARGRSFSMPEVQRLIESLSPLVNSDNGAMHLELKQVYSSWAKPNSVSSDAPATTDTSKEKRGR